MIRLRVRGMGGSTQNMMALRVNLQCLTPDAKVDVLLDTSGCTRDALWNEIASIIDVVEYVASGVDLVVRTEGTPTDLSSAKQYTTLRVATSGDKWAFRRELQYACFLNPTKLKVCGDDKTAQDVISRIGFSGELVTKQSGDDSIIVSCRVDAAENVICVPPSVDEVEDEGGAKEDAVIGFCECCHDHDDTACCK
eukprot:PhM_4_TR262/c0_g1_i1/m.1627